VHAWPGRVRKSVGELQFYYEVVLGESSQCFVVAVNVTSSYGKRLACGWGGGWLPKSCLVHPYSEVRFRAKYSMEEPYALVVHVRICMGGTGWTGISTLAF